MTLLLAELLVQCPKQNLKVKAKEQCEGIPKCEHFKHFAYIGGKVYVVCSYNELKKGEENILFG